MVLSTLATVKWPLIRFKLGTFLAYEACHLFCDNLNGEFGLAYDCDAPRSYKVAESTEQVPICFKAEAAIAVCISQLSVRQAGKATILVEDCQIDIHFTTREQATDFLWTFKGKAPAMLPVYEIPVGGTTAFERASFDMMKSGYVGPTGQTLRPPTCEAMLTIQNLWNTGNFADITVTAGVTIFNVHRAVVCSWSPFFNAAFGENGHRFVEGERKRIDLEEDNVTIRVLLEEIYSIPNAYTGSVFQNFAIKSEKEKDDQLQTLLKVFIAADKYDIVGLKWRASQAIIIRLHFVQDPAIIIKLAKDINEFCPDRDEGLRSAVINQVQKRLKAVLKNKTMTEDLLVSDFLVLALLTRVPEDGPMLDWEAQDKDDGSVSPPVTPHRGRKRTRFDVGS